MHQQLKHTLYGKKLFLGAQSSCKWNHECTHVLVDESSSITVDIIEAILVKKPIVLADWLEVLAKKTICTELPNCISYSPTLTLEGITIRIVDPTIRDKCLEGFTFVFGSLSKYIFGEKFRSLLEVVGAKFINAEDFCSDSQTSADGENNYVLVIPRKSPNELNSFRELSSLARVNDLKLTAAILSGSFDSSLLEQPSIVVSSSRSSDETIVADSDVEMDDATSNIVAATSRSQDVIKHEDEDHEAKMPGNIEDTREHREGNSTGYLDTSCEKIKTSCSRDEGVASMKNVNKRENSLADRHENSDIIFSQDLIVKGINPGPVQSATANVVNFKCFKKRMTVSGNSFSDLIPFAKDPYKEYDYGSNESEYTREEKKRKQLEAVAEDLFNNEKARKRAAGGTSIQSLLSRR